MVEVILPSEAAKQVILRDMRPGEICIVDTSRWSEQTTMVVLRLSRKDMLHPSSAPFGIYLENGLPEFNSGMMVIPLPNAKLRLEM